VPFHDVTVQHPLGDAVGGQIGSPFEPHEAPHHGAGQDHPSEAQARHQGLRSRAGVEHMARGVQGLDRREIGPFVAEVEVGVVLQHGHLMASGQVQDLASPGGGHDDPRGVLEIGPHIDKL